MRGFTVHKVWQQIKVQNLQNVLLGKAHTRIIHIVLQLLLLSNKKIRVLHLRHSLVCMYTQQEVLYVLL